MKYIAHRGNTYGPSDVWENHPEAIREALDLGFDAEIDIWWWQDQFWLGHDRPQYKLNDEKNQYNIDLKDDRLWCHAKNLKAFQKLYENPDIRCFYHTDEDIVLTSKGEIWTYPGIQLLQGAILVVPEQQYRMDGIMLLGVEKRLIEDIKIMHDNKLFIGSGICSDYVSQLREVFG